MDFFMIGDIIWEEDLVYNEISLFVQFLEVLVIFLIVQEVIRLLQKMRYEFFNVINKKERFYWVINE